MKRNSNWPTPAVKSVAIAGLDLFRNDELMCDTECHRISVDRNHQRTAENETEFELFSDRYQRRFLNYQLVDRLRFQPGPNTPVLNWNFMKDLLLSTDLSELRSLTGSIKVN